MIKLLTPLRSNDQKQLYIYERYINMFRKHNIELVCINPCSNETLLQIEQYFDGLFLSGGKDINPKFYQENKSEECILESKEIDEFELLIIQIFDNSNKPMFGVCRGIQTINVYYGGTLHQHIYNHSFCNHNITPVKNTKLYNQLNNEISVNSYHHQSIKKIGYRLIASAYSKDGHIEAIENDKIFACQWHPDKENGLEDYFIAIIKSFFC